MLAGSPGGFSKRNCEFQTDKFRFLRSRIQEFPNCSDALRGYNLRKLPQGDLMETLNFAGGFIMGGVLGVFIMGFLLLTLEAN